MKEQIITNLSIKEDQELKELLNKINETLKKLETEVIDFED